MQDRGRSGRICEGLEGSACRVVRRIIFWLCVILGVAEDVGSCDIIRELKG